MDHKKFEQLIDLIINENEDQARALFHDIVVEKSREIYEDIMSDEMDEGMNPGGQVGQMMDEISAEEEGMTEEEEAEIDFDDEDDDDIVDIEADDDMAADARLRVEIANAIDQAHECLGATEAAHATQHRRAGVLEGQIEVGGHLRCGDHGLDESGSDLCWLQIGHPQARDAALHGQIRQRGLQQAEVTEVLAV